MMSLPGIHVADFNFFDWFVAVLILTSMVLAFRRGLIRAIIGFLGFILGFFIADWDYDMVGDWMSYSRLNLTLGTARVVAFVVIVIVVVAACEMGGWFAQKALRWVGLGWFDRLLGAAFGFARGCLVGVAVLMVASDFAPQSQTITQAQLTPYLFAVAHDVSFLVPEYLLQLMADGSIDFKRGMQH
jgi:membrane protein required for colicin V production